MYCKYCKDTFLEDSGHWYIYGNRKQCKTQKSLIQKQSRADNKVKIKKYNSAYFKKYRAVHKSKLQLYHQTYKNKNTPIPNKQKQRKTQQMYHKLPRVAVARRLRSRIYNAIKTQSGIKSAKSLELLGCSVETVRKHLESLFKPGMTWENRGEWHIDHIRPCISFDLTCPAEQKKCFHYTNLQPLWAKDNISKGGKVRPTPNKIKDAAKESKEGADTYYREENNPQLLRR